MKLYRSALPVIVFLFYGSVFLLRLLGLQGAYYKILYGLGITPLDRPFSDTYAILLAAQCYREGLNVSLPSNPCNVIFSYSPMWLDVVPPFVTTGYTLIVGVAFNLTFVAALYAILRPASWRQLAWFAVASTSSAVTFAVERGNLDLFIFALAALAVILYGGNLTARLGAYVTCFLGGLLKFYPFVLLVISLRESPKLFLKIAATASIAFLVFIAYYRNEIINALHVIPAITHFGIQFGAKNLPFGLTEIYSGEIGVHMPLITYPIFLAVVVECLVIAITFVRRFDSQGIIIDWTAHEARCLLVGSLVIVGCFFFAGQNGEYREINFLFVLSGLMALHRNIIDKRLKYILLFTIGAVLLLMWEGGIRRLYDFLLILFGLDSKVPERLSFIFWLMRELTWWWIVSVLTAMIALFVMHTPLARYVAGLFTSRRLSRN